MLNFDMSRVSGIEFFRDLISAGIVENRGIRPNESRYFDNE